MRRRPGRAAASSPRLRLKRLDRVDAADRQRGEEGRGEAGSEQHRGHERQRTRGGGLDLNNIALYRLSANTPPEAPERVCTYHSADGSTAYADPTFSPRGNAIAFAQDAPGRRADGVYVWSSGNCSGKAKLIARGAKDPDWGPR